MRNGKGKGKKIYKLRRRQTLEKRGVEKFDLRGGQKKGGTLKIKLKEKKPNRGPRKGGAGVSPDKHRGGVPNMGGKI